MNSKKTNAVEWAMTHHRIVILLVCALVVVGIIALPRMNKNEFPDFTIRQGIVTAVCPGFTSEEIEEQVTKPLENYIFSYKEVKKAKTISMSMDGVAVIQVSLNDEVNDKDEFWSKFQHGISNFKNQLPQSVLAVQVIDDFGDTAALLISMESQYKTYRELNTYMDALKDELRKIESIGRMNIYGMQKEQISIYLDSDRLSHYGVSDQTVAMSLSANGFVTTGGRLKNHDYTTPIILNRSLNTQKDIEETVILSTPTGEIVRLKDIAKVVKEYPMPQSYITTNGKNCILLSVEMKTGRNIVSMGDQISECLDSFRKTLPEEVTMTTITDQGQVVGDSVDNFLEELLIAILAVVLVVVLMLPLKVALIAASTIPVTIFMSLALFWAFGIELNTVTLSALIVTLGMIVDNSIVIIDSYLELIAEGVERRKAAINSARHFFPSILSATLAISITFFPFLITASGMVLDFMRSFPWAISIVLFLSLLVAELVVPFLLYWFIRKPMARKPKNNEKRSNSLLDSIQKGYDRLITACFKHYRLTAVIGVLAVVGGLFLMSRLPQRLMPFAERNQFAVEIFMPTGTSLEKTAYVADSLESLMRGDERITSIASFKGTASPRFQNSYAPQQGGSNFAQFIVNTTGNKATEELIDEMTPRYRDLFPEAMIRFKQLGYSESTFPLEFRLSNPDINALKEDAEVILEELRKMPELNLVNTDYAEPLATTHVVVDEHSAQTIGLTHIGIESQLATRYSDGLNVGNTWEGDYSIPIVVKNHKSDNSAVEDLLNEKVSVSGGIGAIPLRQIATIETTWENGKIIKRNGIPTITVRAEVERGKNVIATTNRVNDVIRNLPLNASTDIVIGGEFEESEEQNPNMMAALAIAIALIFVILLCHFKRIRTAGVLMISMSLSLIGAAIGIMVMRLDFIMTCSLGIISLLGILTRNEIIMIDYAEELQREQGGSLRDSILTSAKRRMRPIFLTSAAASMGVIPMILRGSGMWKPMGTVIFFGTLITMVLILTIFPVWYWLLMRTKSRKTTVKTLTNAEAQ